MAASCCYSTPSRHSSSEAQRGRQDTYRPDHPTGGASMSGEAIWGRGQAPPKCCLSFPPLGHERRHFAPRRRRRAVPARGDWGVLRRCPVRPTGLPRRSVYFTPIAPVVPATGALSTLEVHQAPRVAIPRATGALPTLEVRCAPHSPAWVLDWRDTHNHGRTVAGSPVPATTAYVGESRHSARSDLGSGP
jgi:hypothetical protein